MDDCRRWNFTSGDAAASERMLGIQLWLNLPAKGKMTSPKYRDIKEDMVSLIKEEGACIHIISGKYKNTPGAMQPDYVQMKFLEVELESNQQWSWKPPHEHPERIISSSPGH